MFFKSEPNVIDNEKAKVEYYLQQIADAIGVDRLKLPVLRASALQELFETDRSLDQMIGFVGEHLAHDVSGIQVKTQLQPLEKCSSGG